MYMTKEQIIKATGSNAGRVSVLLPYFNMVFEKFQINTTKRQLAFLAQLGHESAGLYYTEELASGDAYDTRIDLGNTPQKDGDGRLYKGRGFIQVTGKANYRTLSKVLNEDLVKNPQLLGAKTINHCTETQLKYAMLSAGWFWDSRKLNTYADKLDLGFPVTAEPNLTAFKNITKKINGGYNGLADRQAKFEAGRKSL